MNKYAVVLGLSLGVMQTVCAEEFSEVQAERISLPLETSSAWAVEITPYLWAPGLKGRISPFKQAPTLKINKSFSDVLNDVDAGGLINLWGRHDRFVFSFDTMYINTKDSEARGPLPAFQLPGLAVPIPPGASIDAKADSKIFTATLMGGYRILDTPQATLDALAGIRFWDVSTRVAVRVSNPLLGSHSASHSEDFHWTDPAIGVRAFFPMTDKLSMQAQTDFGGFGVGAEHTWSLLTTLNYAFSDHLSTSAGYKMLDVDYDKSGHVFDIRLSGLVAGLTYRL